MPDQITSESIISIINYTDLTSPIQLPRYFYEDSTKEPIYFSTPKEIPITIFSRKKSKQTYKPKKIRQVITPTNSQRRAVSHQLDQEELFTRKLYAKKSFEQNLRKLCDNYCEDDRPYGNNTKNKQLKALKNDIRKAKKFLLSLVPEYNRAFFKLVLDVMVEKS